MTATLPALALLLALAAPPGADHYDYHDTFEDEACGSAPSHWIPRYAPAERPWSVGCRDGAHVYEQADPSAAVQYSTLHVFERDPVFEGRFWVPDGPTPQGYVAFLVRYNAEGSYVKLRVDLERGLYEIVEREERDRPQIQRAVCRDALAPGWHRFRVEADGPSVRLSVDGALKVETDALLHRTFGRVGFETAGTRAAFDDVTYRGASGRVNDGVMEYSPVPEGPDGRRDAQHLTITAVSDSLLLGLAGTADDRVIRQGERHPAFLLTSRDQGRTWEHARAGERRYLVADGDTVLHPNPQLLRLQSGHLLSAALADDGRTRFVVSADTAQTWRWAGSISGNDRNGMMPDKLTQTSTGDIFGSINRVLYRSPDEGQTWEAVTDFPLYDADTRYVSVQEMQVVELPDGTLATYARDGRPGARTLAMGRSVPGVQWSDLRDDRNNTPFVSPKNAFSVERDPDDPERYWMFWTYNDRDDEPSVNNLPRTRLALAASTDGTRTWQYVMDVDDWGYPSTGFGDKDNRYSNLALAVTRDHVYLTVKRRDPVGEEKHADTGVWLVRVDKSKVELYDQFPGTHY